jgi:hypothetical protein
MPIIFDPRRVYTSTNGNWTKETWENGNNGSDARNIRVEQNTNDQQELLEMLKNKLMVELYRDVLSANDFGELLEKFGEINLKKCKNVDEYKQKIQNIILEDLFVWGDHIRTTCKKYQEDIDFSDAMYNGFGENTYKIDPELSNSIFNSFAAYQSVSLQKGLNLFFESEIFQTIALMLFTTQQSSMHNLKLFLRDKISNFIAQIKSVDGIDYSNEGFDSIASQTCKIMELQLAFYHQLQIDLITVFEDRFKAINIKLNEKKLKKIDRYKQINLDLIEGKALVHATPQPKFRQIKIGNQTYRVKYYLKNKINQCGSNKKSKLIDNKQ